MKTYPKRDWEIFIVSGDSQNCARTVRSILASEPELRDPSQPPRISVYAEWPEQEFPQDLRFACKFIAQEKPFVITKENNRALRAIWGKGKDAILVEDDVAVESPQLFTKLAQFAEAFRGVCLLSPGIKGFKYNNVVCEPNPDLALYREPVHYPIICCYFPVELELLIGYYDERYTTYGCLSADSRVILADGSFRKISTIVRERQKINVLSMNEETKAIEPQPVIDWHKAEGPEGQGWIKIHLKRAGRSKYSDHGSVFTPDHRLMTDSGWKRADEIKPGDKIPVHERSVSERENEFILREDVVGSVTPWIPSMRTPHKRTRWCISVAHNPNFFTSSGLAHNCDDNDMSLRLYRAGIPMLACPQLVAEHVYDDSVFKVRGRDQWASREKFKAKWGQYPGDPRLR